MVRLRSRYRYIILSQSIFAIGCLKGDNETRVTILEIRISDCDGTNLLKIGDWPDIYDFIFKSFELRSRTECL